MAAPLGPVASSSLEPLFNDFCFFCGAWGPQFFDPGSVVRNRHGAILSVTVMCGRLAECGMQREERL